MESLEFIDEVEAKQIQLPFRPRAVFLYYYQKATLLPLELDCQKGGTRV